MFFSDSEVMQRAIRIAQSGFGHVEPNPMVGAVIVDAGRNLIYLIDSRGEVMDGFPLRGASMFSIGKLSSGDDWNLIVGGTDRFLYNYSLEISQK